MEDKTAFGARVRKLRETKAAKDKNFTLRSFARAAGVSPAFLSQMERGGYAPPGVDKIMRMAELLGCDADEFLALAGRTAPDLEETILSDPAFFAWLIRHVGKMPQEKRALLRAFLDTFGKE